LYYVGSQSTLYKPWSFWISIAEAVYTSLVIFFTAFGQFNGSDMGLWEFGTLQCSQLILAMLVQLGVQTEAWTWIQCFAVALSVGIYLGFGLIYNAVCTNCEGLTNPYWVMQNSFSDPFQYLILLLTLVLTLLPRLCVKALVNTIQPSDLIIAQKLEKRMENTKNKMNQVESKQGFVKFFQIKQ